ncbi:MAG: hypothetical protein ACTSRZ_21150 [Promethearchaeota archaeon]
MNRNNYKLFIVILIEILLDKFLDLSFLAKTTEIGGDRSTLDR